MCALACDTAAADQHTYQVIVRPDPKELPEVAKGDGCIGLKPEVLEVVGRGEVAAFTAEEGKGGPVRNGLAAELHGFPK